MRILMISDVYFPRINGVSTSILTFRREFQENGHQVTLIAPDYGTENGIDPDIYRIPSRYVVVDPEDRMLRYRAILKHADELNGKKFDILHIQTPFVAHYAGLNLARRLALPVVETYHTFFEEYLYNYVRFLPRSTLRFAARRFSSRQCNSVQGLVVPSSPMLEVLRGYGVTTPARVIPTGIELLRIHGGDGAAFRARHGIEAQRPTLVHVGRIAHEKNIDFLLHVVKSVRERLPSVLMIVAGEGPALAGLRKLAHALDIEDNVLFVGYLSRDNELLDCYRAGDAFVFSSRTETQGLVLLEAMALGVPVVSTAVMGTKDILKAGKGALVAEETIPDFTDKVTAILTDAQLRERLSREAGEYVKDWSAEALADNMLDFYEEVIATH